MLTPIRLPQILALALALVMAFPLSALAEGDNNMNLEQNSQRDSNQQAQRSDSTEAQGSHDSGSSDSAKAQGNHDSGSSDSAKTKGNHDSAANNSTGAEEGERVRREHVKDKSLEDANMLRREGEQEHFLTFINGQRVAMNPKVEDGHLLVPFRRLAESLGATVVWDPAGNGVTMTLGSTTVQMRIGAGTALVNGHPVQLQTPARIDDGHTFVPLRFITEALGATVGYDPATGAVTVVTAPAPTVP